MSRLKFEDIDEWTPSSISIVDVPAHPLCVFEVYEDDEEYVKKSIEIDGEMMVENQTEPKVEVSESFFERLLGKTVLKAEEEPVKPPEKPQENKDSIAKLEERIAKLESKVAELEKEEPKEENKPDGAVPDAVAKSESEGETSEATESEVTETEEEPKEIIDEKEVVSKSLDPDMITTTESDKTLVERAGRQSNGMTW